jgi:hypothetical protein
MIVQTRFRDIPFDALRQCHPQVSRDRWETVLRAQSVNLETPGITDAPWDREILCSGPFYKSDFLRSDGRYAYLCEHIAEIGD